MLPVWWFLYIHSAIKTSHQFHNQKISSITIDAHKMFQAPYGTEFLLVKVD
jgi:glutamate/tyrosine decarboxylase-like PLP-dependent enzyme